MPEGLIFTINENSELVRVKAPDVVLTPDEQVGADIIVKALEGGGVSTGAVFYERTKQYLKFIDYKYYTFCNLKLIGSSKYMELWLDIKDRNAYSDDPRFSKVDFHKNKWVRFPLSCVEDIALYRDFIVPGHACATRGADE